MPVLSFFYHHNQYDQSKIDIIHLQTDATAYTDMDNSKIEYVLSFSTHIYTEVQAIFLLRLANNALPLKLHCKTAIEVTPSHHR